MFNLIESARKLYRYNSAVDIFVSFTRNEKEFILAAR